MGFVALRRGAVRGTEGTARPLLHMLPLSPEFYFLCLRSLRVPAPWGQLPKGLLLVFTLPSPVALGSRTAAALVLHRAGAEQDVPGSPGVSCSCSQCFLQPWPTVLHGLALESLAGGELEPCVPASVSLNSPIPEGLRWCRACTEQLPPSLLQHLQPQGPQ